MHDGLSHHPPPAVNAALASLLTAALAAPGTGSGSPAAADTLEARMPELGAPARAHLPDARLLEPGMLTFSTGWHSPPGGSEAGEPGSGSGNQTYHGEVGWGVSRRVSLHTAIEVNDDPTWARIRGERRGQSRVAVALAGTGSVWSSASLRLGVRTTAEMIWQSSAPGLFNAGDRREEDVFPALAVDLPLTWRLSPRWEVDLVPSWAALPSRILGAPYYGDMGRLGGGLRAALGRGWAVEATGELPLGPGENVIDRDGAFRRLPTWRVGARWRATRRVVLTGHLTNSAGTSPATRHLTVAGSPTTLYGVGVGYSPSVEEGVGGRGRPEAGEVPGDAPRVTLPAPRTLPSGARRLALGVDTRGAYALRFVQAVGRRIQAEFLGSRLRGADAPRRLETDVGSGPEYRFALQLDLAAQAEGAMLNWTHRVSAGRDWDDQQGYLLVEGMASRTIREGLTLSLNPLLIQSGGRNPLSVGFGAEVMLGPTRLLPEWRGSPTEPPVFAIGLGPLSRWQTPAGHVRGHVFVTNASGTVGLGRILRDGDRFRGGVEVSLDL